MVHVMSGHVRVRPSRDPLLPSNYRPVRALGQGEIALPPQSSGLPLTPGCLQQSWKWMYNLVHHHHHREQGSAEGCQQKQKGAHLQIPPQPEFAELMLSAEGLRRRVDWKIGCTTCAPAGRLAGALAGAGVCQWSSSSLHDDFIFNLHFFFSATLL